MARSILLSSALTVVIPFNCAMNRNTRAHRSSSLTICRSHFSVSVKLNGIGELANMGTELANMGAVEQPLAGLCLCCICCDLRVCDCSWSAGRSRFPFKCAARRNTSSQKLVYHSLTICRSHFSVSVKCATYDGIHEHVCGREATGCGSALPLLPCQEVVRPLLPVHQVKKVCST